MTPAKNFPTPTTGHLFLNRGEAQPQQRQLPGQDSEEVYEATGRRRGH
jgi:hypothetical protein